MTLRLTISRAILIFGLITALGLGAVIATSVYGLSQLKVGGPLYNQIKLGNDLIADILPPPEYVIEAYLEATLVLHDPAQLAAHRDRIAQLKKEYDERRRFLGQVRSRSGAEDQAGGEIRQRGAPLLDRDPGRPAARARQGRQRRGGESPMPRSPRVTPRTAPSSTTSSSRPTTRTRRRKSRRRGASAHSRLYCGAFRPWCFSSSAPAFSAWHSASFVPSRK